MTTVSRCQNPIPVIVLVTIGIVLRMCATMRASVATRLRLFEITLAMNVTVLLNDASECCGRDQRRLIERFQHLQLFGCHDVVQKVTRFDVAFRGSPQLGTRAGDHQEA